MDVVRCLLHPVVRLHTVDRMGGRTGHSLLLDLSLAVATNPWVVRAVRQLSLPLLGLAWLICIFWLEHYFRTGSRTNRLMARTARVAVITVGAYLTIVTLRLLVLS